MKDDRRISILAVAVSVASLGLAGYSQIKSVRRDTINDLYARIAEVERKLIECEQRAEILRRENLDLLQRLVADGRS